MTLEDFNTMEDQEKAALLESFDQARLESLEAEKNSFASELQEVKKELGLLKDENRKTKELNFTLARKLDVSGKHESAEDILHNMFKRGDQV